MKQQSIYTFATWQVKKEYLQNVLMLLPELVQRSMGEEGNLLYKIYQSHSDTNTLILVEGYKDEAALDKHRVSDHFKNLVINQIVPLLEKREILITHELLHDEGK